MIPEFPEFKKLELSDKEEVEKFTNQFPPYSDFNFVSMWSWDIKGDMRISQLNGNLVVRFNDYITGKPLYSFLGNNNLDDTAERLLGTCKAVGVECILKFVPEETAKQLSSNKFTIEEDPDHFDYIVRLDEIKDYSHPKTKSRKRAVKGFLKNFNPELRLLDLTDINNQNKLLQSFINKSVQDNKITENEFLAVLRFINSHTELGTFMQGLFLGDELIGFSFCEIVNTEYANFHFWRANTQISKSTYDYLLQASAVYLHEMGCRYLNMEQDLGIENLRNWKSSLGDFFYLKKYTVALA